MSINGKDAITADATVASIMAVINKCMHVKFVVKRDPAAAAQMIVDDPQIRRESQQSATTSGSSRKSSLIPGAVGGYGASNGAMQDDLITPGENISNNLWLLSILWNERVYCVWWAVVLTHPLVTSYLVRLVRKVAPRSSKRRSASSTSESEPYSRRRSRATTASANATPSYVPTPSTREKSERARRGQARRGGSVLESARKDDAMLQQERTQLKDLQEEMLKDILGEKQLADLTPPQRASLRKSALLKAKRKMSSVADHDRAVKADLLKEKVLKQTRASIWELSDAERAAQVQSDGSPATQRRISEAAAKAAKLVENSAAAAAARDGSLQLNGSDGTSNGASGAPPSQNGTAPGRGHSIMSPSSIMSSPTYDTLDDLYAPRGLGSNDGLKNIDVAMHGRKLGFSVEQDAEGHHFIQTIKPVSWLLLRCHVLHIVPLLFFSLRWLS